MMDWTKVVTHPLGLAAFALFLIFLVVARSVREPAWLKKFFATLAIIVVIGGLFLAYQHQNSSNTGDVPRIQQKTTGDNSPAVQGIDGDVNITIDQNKSQKGTKQK